MAAIFAIAIFSLTANLAVAGLPNPGILVW
jgi:hypothetical protein